MAFRFARKDDVKIISAVRGTKPVGEKKKKHIDVDALLDQIEKAELDVVKYRVLYRRRKVMYVNAVRTCQPKDWIEAMRDMMQRAKKDYEDVEQYRNKLYKKYNDWEEIMGDLVKRLL